MHIGVLCGYGGGSGTASGHTSAFPALHGAARRAPLAGVTWTVAAFTLVGLPFTGGLVTKILLGQEALRHSLPVASAVLAVLALSTLLNVLYFLRPMLWIWSPPGPEKIPEDAPAGGLFSVSAVCLALLPVLVFFFSSPLLELISAGLNQFS